MLCTSSPSEPNLFSTKFPKGQLWAEATQQVGVLWVCMVFEKRILNSLLAFKKLGNASVTSLKVCFVLKSLKTFCISCGLQHPVPRVLSLSPWSRLHTLHPCISPAWCQESCESLPRCFQQPCVPVPK